MRPEFVHIPTISTGDIVADISNITQALAIATTTDTAVFEHSVLMLALLDDIRNVIEELETTKQYYQMSTVPLLMIHQYFEGFAAQLAENEVSADNETAAAELAKKTSEEAEAIYDKLARTLNALSSAMASYDELIAMTTGMAQGTKDLTATIKAVQNS